MRGAFLAMRGLRWGALLLQNLSAALHHTALQIEAELDSPHTRRPSGDPAVQRVASPADVYAVSGEIPPGVYDDHGPMDGELHPMRNEDWQ